MDATFDEALEAGLVRLCGDRADLLAHAVRAPQPRSQLLPLAVLCGHEALAHAELGRMLAHLSPPGTGLTRAVIHGQCAVWVSSIADSVGFLRGALLAHYGIRSGAAFPVIVGAKLAAVIELFCFDRLERESDLETTATLLAIQLGDLAGHQWN